MLTVRLTDEFQKWLDELRDKRAQIRIVARLRQTEAGNLGDWASVGGDVSEMRVHFTRRGSLLIIMLAGGDKSTQSRDIRRAQRIALKLGTYHE